ncbi:hypothetical protein N7471_010789 [Penicillium samsonianum]|uniref:uncharacterized protein n=1 Tax=Penicillium samsonianum TaxID=1882272 RepID=UPI0025487384|nr:uncharacterized protein N7471_010789 [Penicillium samsonianum]KAJ6126296.1 hypothetical protein N7471_010789 [Penicillium samsonianum]
MARGSGTPCISSAATHIGNNHKTWPNARESPSVLLSSTAVPPGARAHNTGITRGRAVCRPAGIKSTVVTTAPPAVLKTFLVARSAAAPAGVISVLSAALGPDAGTPGLPSAEYVPAGDYAPRAGQCRSFPYLDRTGGPRWDRSELGGCPAPWTANLALEPFRFIVRLTGNRLTGNPPGY